MKGKETKEALDNLTQYLDGVIDINYEWIPVFSEPGVQYTFTTARTRYLRQNYSIPAIYRWHAFNPELNQPEQYYVGETNNLYGRINFYLRIDATQKTNIRLRTYFQEHLQQGFQIQMELLHIDSLTIDKSPVTLDNLQYKYFRVMLENYFIYRLRCEGFTLLNL